MELLLETGQKVYQSLSEIEKVDLVILAIPGAIAVSYLDEVKTAGVKNIVLFAAGFKEKGEGGELLEKQLLEKAKELLKWGNTEQLQMQKVNIL